MVNGGEAGCTRQTGRREEGQQYGSGHVPKDEGAASTNRRRQTRSSRRAGMSEETKVPPPQSPRGVREARGVLC